MSGGRKLATIANRLVPGYLERFDWGDTWERPLEDGTAFEWTLLAALASQAERAGWDCSYPILQLSTGPALFRLYNEIPHHHHAQAGHAAGATYRDHDLADRFLQAFIPKLLLQKGDLWYSVFREGCPYYKVMTRPDFDERPDILMLPGRPSPGYPVLTTDGHMMDFSFDLLDGTTICGRLRVVVRSTIPCVTRTPTSGYAVPVAGIVEVSTSKSPSVAGAQLERYEDLFGRSGAPPPLVLITGNELGAFPWPSISVDLSQDSIIEIEQGCLAAAGLALATFGMV